MTFNPTGSVVSTDLDNMLRGLFRDNSDHAVSGPIVETTMASTSVSANTIGPTGGLHILAAGSGIGAGGGKTVKIYFGTAVLLSFPVPAGNQCWYARVYLYNTSTGAQRVVAEAATIAAAVGSSTNPVFSAEFSTPAIDTTQNQTAKITTTNANAGDTLTQSMWDGFVVQIN